MSGEITLSIELELGWGSHMCSKYSRYSFRREEESKYLKKLLTVCDEYGVPITFNVVGKLLTDRNFGDQRPDLYPNGWWEEYENANQDLLPLFHAPDLIEAIRDAKLNHEFATHTFSHIMTDEVSEECFRYECEKMQEIYDTWDIDQPTSFVSPRHRQFDSTVLNDHDIRVVRVPDPEESDPSTVTSLWMVSRKHPVKKPRVEDGIVKTYSSSYPSLTYSGVLPKGQLEADPQFQCLPLKLRQYLHQRYLKDAVKRASMQNSNAHLWTHLWDMANEAQWEPIETFIKWLGEQAETDNIDVLRMKELSKAEHRT